MTPAVTIHAYERFQERFFPCSYPVACAYILGGIVRTWVAAGATRVLRGDLEVYASKGAIVTVVRRDNPARGFSSAKRARAEA